MAQTPNYGLYAVDPADLSSNVLDVLQATDGVSSTSNIMKIDALLKELSKTLSFRIVESADEPKGLEAGNEWDRVLEEVT